ncbi:(Fe-S)-binding protein [bacterium]|nr:(Fe-S)-binding protein [bacterium]MBU1984260.1 (Fe-S)-binding protein [bacterium]
MAETAQIQIDLKRYRINECLECGRCTAVCPVAKTHAFSPRRSLSFAISNSASTLASDTSVWACLTCRRCELVCPAEIPYSAANRSMRALLRGLGVKQTCTHGGVFEQITSLMTRPGLEQNRLGWVTKDLKVKQKGGDTLFFTGCSPYFAAYFGEPYAEHLLGSLRAAVKLMNKVGIEPLVLANERCCGHDALLRGEVELFETLAGMVKEQIQANGVKRVVFTCPECFSTLRDDHPSVVGKWNVELLHISDVLSGKLSALPFRETKRCATYQDPCRLGRYSNHYEEPRKVVGAIPQFELREMEHNRQRAICCGNTAWIGCDGGTKQMQKQRLAEATATGSDVLLTACPKCLIHLTCSLSGDDGAIGESLKIQDLWEFTASCLE